MPVPRNPLAINPIIEQIYFPFFNPANRPTRSPTTTKPDIELAKVPITRPSKTRSTKDDDHDNNNSNNSSNNNNGNNDGNNNTQISQKLLK